MSEILTISDGMHHIKDKRRIERLQDFSKYVSVLPWFNIDVLHKFYINVFLPEQKVAIDDSQLAQEDFSTDEFKNRAITCADIFHSPYVVRIDKNIYVLHDLIRLQLRTIIDTQPKVILQIGNFMLAYIQDCQKHVPSVRFKEVYRIEGNLILNPDKEAGRIVDHIIRQLNNSNNVDAKLKVVEYYFKRLDGSSDQNIEHQGLKNFMEAFQSVAQGGNVSERQAEGIQGTSGNSINIKIPDGVKRKIVAGINKAAVSRKNPMREGIEQRKATKKFRALVVGIDNYQNEKIFPLRSAVSDAKKMRHYLSENISVFEMRTLLNEEATRVNFLSEMDKMSSHTEEGDVFLFYFAGYGGQKKDLGSTEADGYNECLLFHDYSVENYPVADDELNYLLNRFKPGTTIYLILDTGYARSSRGLIFSSGGSRYYFRSIPWLLEERPENEYFLNLQAQRQVLNLSDKVVNIFSAAKDKQDCLEKKNGGLFTRELIKQLNFFGKPFTIQELLVGIRNIQIPKGIEQTPTFTGSNPSNIFLETFLKFDFQRIIEKAKQEKATTLDLSYRELIEIPPEVFELEHLESLQLSWNEISEINIPEGALPNLETLNISNNRLTKLGGVLKRDVLPKLSFLSVRNNNIDLIDPKWFSEVGREMNIDLIGNDLFNLDTKRKESYEFYFNYFNSEYIEQTSDKIELLWFDLQKKPSRHLELFNTLNSELKGHFNATYINSLPDAKAFFECLYRVNDRLCLINIFTDANEENVFNRESRYAALASVFKLCFKPDQLPFIIIPKQFESLSQELMDIGFPLIINVDQKGRNGKAKMVGYLEHFYKRICKGNTILKSHEISWADAPQKILTKNRDRCEISFQSKNENNLNWRMPVVESGEMEAHMFEDIGLESSQLSWPSVKIYVNDIDGLEVFDNELKDFKFPVENVITRNRDEADCWLNVFNHTVYFSAANEAYKPWSRPIDLFDQMAEELLKVFYFNVVNYLRIENLTSILTNRGEVGIDIKGSISSEWMAIERFEKINLSEFPYHFEKLYDTSPLLEKRFFDIRITNNGKKPFFLCVVMLFSDFGIGTSVFDGKSEMIKPGESKELFGDDLKGNTQGYISLKHYTIDYRWKKDEIKFKLLLGEEPFEIHDFNQYQSWNLRKRKSKGLFTVQLCELPHEILDTKDFTIQLNNEVEAKSEIGITDNQCDDAIDRPIITSRLMQLAKSSSFEQSVLYIHPDYLDPILERRFQVKRSRNRELQAVYLLGHTVFRPYSIRPTFLESLQRSWPVLSHNSNNSEDYLNNAISRVNEHMRKFELQKLLIFDLPDLILHDQLGKVADEIIIAASLVQEANALLQIITSHYDKLLYELSILDITLIGIDYLNLNQLRQINNDYLKGKAFAITEDTTNMINEFIDRICKELINISRKHQHVTFLDLRNRTAPTDWQSLWKPSLKGTPKLTTILIEEIRKNTRNGPEQSFA